MLTEIGFVDIEIGPPVDTFGDARGEANARTFEVYGYAFLARKPHTAPSSLDSPAEPDRSMVSTQEQDARDRFADRYREERVDVVREIEQRVIGGDWGANGYTTIAQADDLADRLRLRQWPTCCSTSAPAAAGPGSTWPRPRDARCRSPTSPSKV